MTLNALIIDDNEADRYILKRQLRKCPFETLIMEATDGQNAISYFEENAGRTGDGYPPTVIFLDINMPRINGFEFLKRFDAIRDAQGLASTVIIMFSSSPREDDRERAFQWPFVTDFLIKGEFDVADLNNMIAKNCARAAE